MAKIIIPNPSIFLLLSFSLNSTNPVKLISIIAPTLNTGYATIAEIDDGRNVLPKEVTEQVEIEIKYEGYIKRQISQVKNFKKMERSRIRLCSMYIYTMI